METKEIKVTIIEENYIDSNNLIQKTKLLLDNGNTYPLFEEIIYNFRQYWNLAEIINSEIQKETTLFNLIDNWYKNIKWALYQLGYTTNQINDLI